MLLPEFMHHFYCLGLIDYVHAQQIGVPCTADEHFSYSYYLITIRKTLVGICV